MSVYVLLIGDLHGEISLVGRIVARLDQRFALVPDLIVQVGDWGFFADAGEWPRVLRVLPLAAEGAAVYDTVTGHVTAVAPHDEQ